MKTTSLVMLATAVCATLAVAAENDPASRQFQVYPKNLARQNVGSNLFLYKAANQTYVPTEAAAAWMDEDVSTGWPMLAGKQHYLVALPQPELVSNFSFSAKPADGTVSIYAGDEPAVPGARTWTPLATNVPFNSINDKKLDKPFTKFAKYILIETDLSNPGPVYSMYLYGEKPATLYTMKPREAAIDSRAIFGPYVNNQTVFNANALYTGASVTAANSTDTSMMSWQKAIDDNPETSVALNAATSQPSAVIQYNGSQSISRVSLLTDGKAKGKLDFFVMDDTAAVTSLEGKTPTVSIVQDGSNPRASMDFPAVTGTKLAVRWTPDTPGETINVEELGSFGNTSLNDTEVSLRPEAAVAYNPVNRSSGNGKDAKEIAEGPSDPKDPAEVAEGPRGGSYLPGALGFPPNVSFRRVQFLSQ